MYLSRELRLADLANRWASTRSGRSSITSPITMCPDVTQFLSYMAGRTTRAKLGSMVIVLPLA
ncbi:MAG: hypothetical protein U0531_13030 [Dehalococcoidia bacterium]